LLEWEWLNAFEESGSMTPESGWLPVHLTLWDGDSLKAAAPLYVKSHSQGEFVWDYMWADVASQLDVQYYPKLVGMSPATPVSGYRFLVDPDENEQALTQAMLETIDGFCTANNLSGCGFNFVDPSWAGLVETYGYASWKHQGFVWENPGYDTFDDYLMSFTKNQRRNIRRERKAMADQDITIKVLTGNEITPAVMDVVYRYYVRTNRQFGPWGAEYLNGDFFKLLLQGFTHRILVFAAYEPGDEDPVGMSFCLYKGNRILGRYWGAARFIDSLHFNLCFYSPIEYAIQNGITFVDPGMGSSHKVRRGFISVSNLSLHRFADEKMRLVMNANMDYINSHEQERIDDLNDALPLVAKKRKDGDRQ
jgi:predicted N-acyltransferase